MNRRLGIVFGAPICFGIGGRTLFPRAIGRNAEGYFNFSVYFPDRRFLTDPPQIAPMDALLDSLAPRSSIVQGDMYQERYSLKNSLRLFK